MKVFIKNEVIGKKNVKLAKMLVNDYKAVCNTGVYRLEAIETVGELNKLIKRVILTLGEPSIYPFVTPLDDALMVNFRQMDIGAMRFK